MLPPRKVKFQAEKKESENIAYYTSNNHRTEYISFFEREIQGIGDWEVAEEYDIKKVL